MLQIIRFCIVGFIAFLIHLISLSVLVSLNILSKPQANIVAFSIAFCISYVYQKSWVFNTKGAATHSFIKYLMMQVSVAFILNQGLFNFLISYTALDYRIICFMSCLVVAILTFTLNKFWVFK